MGVSDRLRDLRVRAGLTKTALARPRYTVSFVSQIEAGRRNPSPEAVAFFAERLGVSAGYLSTGIPENVESELRYRLEEAGELLRSGHPDRAEELARRVWERAGEYGLGGIANQALVQLGQSLGQQDKMQEALDAYEEALDGDLPDRDRAVAVAGLARTYRVLGDLSYAADVIESFMSRPDRGPLDPSMAAELQSVLVSIYFERGDIVRAERAGRRALSAASQGASPELRARTYWYTSRVLAERRNWNEALEYATRARVLMEEMDDQRSVARLHNAYAFICLEAEPPRLEEARRHLEQAESLLEGGTADTDLAYVLTERARLELLGERFDEALQYAEQALSHVSRDAGEAARSLFLKGRALSALGRSEEAEAVLREAASSFHEQGARQQEASCWRELGHLRVEAGDLAGAVEALLAGFEAIEPRRARA
jgi:tetratricopeptide (TPR) repeat protein